MLLVLLLEGALHVKVELALALDALLLHVADDAFVHGLDCPDGQLSYGLGSSTLGLPSCGQPGRKLQVRCTRARALGPYYIKTGEGGREGGVKRRRTARSAFC